MHIPSLVVRCLLALALALNLLGCGGGGGGGGGGSGVPSVGPGQFGVVAGPTGAKIAGLNVPVNLSFSKNVDPATVNSFTIKVVSVTDPSGISTAPPGHLPSVSFSTSGSLVTITPQMEFSREQVEYGFLANALYEIAFAPPSDVLSVESTGGESLVNSSATFFFRTNDKGFDFNPGYPHVRAFVVDDPDTLDEPVLLPSQIVDDGDGDLTSDVLAYFGDADAPGGLPIEITQAASPIALATTTAQSILFIFDDALNPTTVVNTLDGSSPSLDVAINAAKPPILSPKTMPGRYSIIHQQGNLTLVQWEANFEVFPPGAFVFVTVLPTVEDLAGNSKKKLIEGSTTDLRGALFVTSSVAGSFTLTEPFDDSTQSDVAATSADWPATDSSSGKSVLAPVQGGGTGADGLLVVDPVANASNPGITEIPPVAVINFTTKTVALPTVGPAAGGLEPRQWSFSTVSIPVGWTLAILTDRNGDGTLDPDEYVVQSPGHPLDGRGAPLMIRCTGQLEVFGTIDLSGEGALTIDRPTGVGDPDYAAYRGQGGEGAQAIIAAGDGGSGGDVLLLDENGDVAFPLISPLPSFQTSDGKLRGVTGISGGLTATTLSDAAGAFAKLTDPDDSVLPALLAAGEIRLQPNLGVGSSAVGNSGTPNESIDENHPTFVLSGVTDDTTVSVTSQFGDMTQASENAGNSFAPIASSGDSYLIGRLQGRPGLDATSLARGGGGAEPYVVVNEGALGVTTTGGGGGGGGGFEPGSDGESDGPDSNPLVNQRGGSHGIAKDDSIGATGGWGAVRGTATAASPTTLILVTQTSGRPLAELAAGQLVDSYLIPNAANDGWMFRITAFNGATFTLEPIATIGGSIDLTDGPGAGGPGLSLGQNTSFAIVPLLEIGGAGGGGSGVSITGTLNSAPSVLPQLTPGGGGGSGGGSLMLETASSMLLGPLCRLIAEGGAGGLVFGQQSKYAGGGGGGGGNIILRAGQTLDVSAGALISVAGGVGGSEPGFGQGGRGGAGFIRFEDFSDTLDPVALSQFTIPALTAVNVGRMFGELQGVGQSLFYLAPVANPEWLSANVKYVADTNGDFVTEPFVWSFTSTGAVSTTGGGAAFADGLSTPPIRLQFNCVGFGPGGFLDSAKQDNVFYEAYDLVSARTGLAYDPATGVLLACVGEGAHEVRRLDTTTLAPVSSGPTTILLPFIPSVSSDTLDVLSIAAGGPDNELFLLERDTFRVHVVSLATGAFRRTIQLPTAITGALTYLPSPIDRLVVADNRNDKLLVFRPRDPGGSLTLDYSPSSPEAQYDVRRDSGVLDSEIVGLTYDAVSQTLWCSDARAGRLFEVSMATGTEGVSTTGSDAYSTLIFDAPGAPPPVGVVPSAVAFDGTSLYLVHAVDREDARVRALLPSAVDPGATGANTVLTSFGTLLPLTPVSIADGDTFLRFKLLIEGDKLSGATQFAQVSVDQVEFIVENQGF